MTPQAQRIAIAKACGLTILSDGITHHLTPCGKKTERDPEGCLLKECPDYLNDLNAMHELEKTLIGKPDYHSPVYAEYCRQIYAITKNPYSATAAQRAEAFLKTIGQWID